MKETLSYCSFGLQLNFEDMRLFQIKGRRAILDFFQKQYNAWFECKAKECTAQAEGYSDRASGAAAIAMKMLMKYF